ncbi:MAG: hypothetical protein RI885_2470 [Actinomycetota bacterium]
MPGAGYRERMRYSEWTTDDAAAHIAVPTAADDKYSRGVLGLVTGSEDYPGAAVIGVEAALHTGVGMVRYLGPERCCEFVLQRRPEAVTVDGRVQAWLVGSGMDRASRGIADAERLAHAFSRSQPTVVDAGALDLLDAATSPVVITPHAGELARVLEVDRSSVLADPGEWAVRAAERLGVAVLLKGAATHIADPDGTRLVVESTVAWTATAGSGDALAGILGALVATHSDEVVSDRALLAKLAATAAVIHAAAAARVSGGGPFVVLDLASEAAAVVAGLLASRARD